jgi:hypothetical protein
MSKLPPSQRAGTSQCYDQILEKTNISLTEKRQFFEFIFENHNIGPWSVDQTLHT